MRAVAVNLESHALEVKRVPEPKPPTNDQVLFRVHQIGVCGTDREIAGVRLVRPPEGDSFLTIGHEALGQVVETGPGVKDLKPGDWVVPMVRRPCPGCRPCASGRMDLCETGDYVERGIVRMHGYFTDFAVDESPYLLPVPDSLVDVAILVEPLTSVEKSIEVAKRAHTGFYRFDPPRALVLGAGTIGILAAMALTHRGFNAAVCSRERDSHPRVRLLEMAGIRYFQAPEAWPADIVIEATGDVEALVTGARCLARNGVMIVLGSPNGTIPFPFRDMIMKNQAVIGSVNSTAESFRQAREDLTRFDRQVLQRMIRRVGFDDFEQTLKGPLSSNPKMVHVLE